MNRSGGTLKSSTRFQITQEVLTELFYLCLDIFQVTDSKNKMLTMQQHEHCVYSHASDREAVNICDSCSILSVVITLLLLQASQ